MTMIAFLLFAASVTFNGYVPPHLASDGVRFRVAAANVDIPAAMKACGIDDFAAVTAGHVDSYQFAVPRAAEASARCMRGRLPAGSRIAPLDHWIVDAQAH